MPGTHIVKAIANGRTCWLAVSPSGEAVVHSPPVDEPTLCAGDVVEWRMLSTFRVILRTRERPYPCAFEVQYAPSTPQALRQLRVALQDELAPGRFIGTGVGTGIIRCASQDQIPEGLSTVRGVSLRARALPSVPWFVSTILPPTLHTKLDLSAVAQDYAAERAVPRDIYPQDQGGAVAQAPSKD